VLAGTSSIFSFVVTFSGRKCLFMTCLDVRPSYDLPLTPFPSWKESLYGYRRPILFFFFLGFSYFVLGTLPLPSLEKKDSSSLRPLFPPHFIYQPLRFVLRNEKTSDPSGSLGASLSLFILSGVGFSPLLLGVVSSPSLCGLIERTSTAFSHSCLVFKPPFTLTLLAHGLTRPSDRLNLPPRALLPDYVSPFRLSSGPFTCLSTRHHSRNRFACQVK